MIRRVRGTEIVGSIPASPTNRKRTYVNKVRKISDMWGKVRAEALAWRAFDKRQRQETYNAEKAERQAELLLKAKDVQVL